MPCIISHTSSACTDDYRHKLDVPEVRLISASISASCEMVRSHTQELLAGPRTRATCDRCHAQKLRCVKSADHPDCLRCAKHGTSCIFSIRTRRRIRDPSEGSSAFTDAMSLTRSPAAPSPGYLPAQGSTEATSLVPSSTCLSLQGAQLSLAGMPSMQSPVNHDAWAMDFNNLFAADGLDPVSTVTSIEARNSPDCTTLDIVRELGSLNVRLYDHFCTLPTPPHHARDSNPASGPKSRGCFAVDETFTLTNAFIMLLRQLQVSLNDPVNAGASMDQATTFLILSCFHRLMDIHGFIANSIQGCSQNPQMPLPGEQPLVTLPPLQLGSFTPQQLQRDGTERPPSLSTISLHMTVVLTMSSQLCHQLHEIITSGLEEFNGEHTFGLSNTMISAEPQLSDLLLPKPSLVSNAQARMEIDQRWSVLTGQFRTAKQAVIMCSATAM